MIRTNVMLTPQQHTTIKQAASEQQRSFGDLVREAIDTTFPNNSIERRHHVALAAYCEGFISLGKLAESLGIDPVSAREYLNKRGIKVAGQTKEEIFSDAANA